MERKKILEDRLNDYLDNKDEVEDLDDLLDQLEQELLDEI